MSKRIAILHFASPPTVGGVEVTIAYHARGLADLGYTVRVITGSGAEFDPRVETWVDSLFGSKDARILQAKAILDTGQIPPDYGALVAEIKRRLRQALTDCHICIVHNAHTLHKNLALTTALYELAQQPHTARQIAWAHDLAWTNPQYAPELHAGAPWDALRQAWAGVRYVTVSHLRRQELADLLRIPPERIAVITAGMDLARWWRWTPATQRIVHDFALLEADTLFLLPARLTRRKNIKLALDILAQLRQHTGRDMRLLVTGPPGPHNPNNMGYYGELLALRQQLGLQTAAHFVYELDALTPDDDTIADLYRLCDALLFPSTQEGFGIPMLEAGLSRMPIYCADIPPLRQTGQDDALYFDPEQDSPELIAQRILTDLAHDARHRLSRRVRQQYRWESILQQQLIPILEEMTE